MSDQQDQTSLRYLTFMAIKPILQPGIDQGIFWDIASKAIKHHGGISRTLSGNTIHAVFGLDEDNREYQGLAACLSAQRLQDLQACQIALHADYIALPCEVRDAGPVLSAMPAQAVLGLCDSAGPGQIVLSAIALNSVQNQALTRTISLPHADEAGFGSVHILRKIIDRNTPLFYLRHTLNQPVPLIGREEEFQSIVDYAEDCFQKQSMHLHIEGEAGSGKTRLLYGIIDHLSDEHENLRILASPSGHLHPDNSNPIQEFLCDISGQGGFIFKNRSEVRNKFIQIGLVNDLYACAYLDAHGMSGVSGLWTQMEPSEQQFLQAELSARIAAYISQHSPMIVLFDDVHKNWGYKQVLVQALRNNFENARIFVLSISKKPNLFKGAQDRVIHLRVLPHRDIQRIVSTILSDDAVLQSYIEEITVRADGNPYFAIQLSNHLKKESTEKRDQTSKVAIPESLDSLFAFQIQQMDRNMRDVLSCCAVLGQICVTHPIYKMLDIPEEAIARALQQLQEQGLLHLVGSKTEVYEFTHDLAQECIYRALPQSDKAELHKRALIALRRMKAGSVSSRLPHMAHHAFQANMYEIAYACAFAAGMIDLELCIPSQAEENMSLALIALRHMPDSPRQQKRAAYTLLHLARAMALNCKPKESLDVLNKIPVTTHQTQLFRDQRTLLETSIKWSTANYTYDEIKEIESRISLGTRMGIGNSLRCAGMLSDLGYFSESNDYIAKIHPLLLHTDSKGHFGMLFPASSYCLALMSCNYAEMGQFDHAHIHAVAACEEIEHMFPAKKVYALAFSAVHYQRQNQHDKAQILLKEAYFLAKEFQIGLIFPFAACNYAYSLYMGTRDPAAFSIMRNGLAYARQRGYYCRWGLHNFQYAQMLDIAGHPEEAARQGLIALRSAQKRHEKHIEAVVGAFLTERGVAYASKPAVAMISQADQAA